MKKTSLIVITIVLILLSISTVYAISSEELEQKRTELKAKINEAGQNLEQINVELTENLEAINELDKEIYDYEEQIKETTNNIKIIEEKIEQTEEYLKTIETRYEHQKELLEQRLVYAYEAGPTRYLDVLLSSKSIVDFISKYYLISEVLEYDQNLLDGIEKEKKEITEIEQSLVVSRDNLKVIRTNQKKMIIDLENVKVERNIYVNKLTDEEKKIQEELDLYQMQLDLVELDILQATLNGEELQYVGGTFAWPVPGYYTITSTYGMRLHPVLKVYRLHTGTDIGAPTGTYAVAANDGIVTTATYSSSYGNMVIIDHGGGVKTLYAHGSEILVQVGDRVSRGDPILKVGSTGWSTGPHLHFEIRVNGQTIDPYPYIVNSIRRTNTENTLEESE